MSAQSKFLKRLSVQIVLASLLFAMASSPSRARTAPHAKQINSTQQVVPGLTAARELLAKSELDAAERAARNYIASNPTKSDGHFLLGLILFRQVQSVARSRNPVLAPGDIPSTAMDANRRNQKIQESLAAYTAGAKFGKPSAGDLKVVSLEYVLLEDYVSADKWLTLALEWDPRDAEAWYYLGRTKYSENRFEEAVVSYQKCLALRSDYVLAANGLGLSYAGLNRNVEAASWMRKAIALQENAASKTPEPYIDLGDLLNQEARFEEALPLLEQALSIDPKNIRAHEKLGKTFLSLNRLPEAQRELEAAIALDANQASFHYLLGQVYRKLGQLEKAKAEMATFQTLKAKEPPRKSGMQ